MTKLQSLNSVKFTDQLDSEESRLVRKKDRYILCEGSQYVRRIYSATRVDTNDVKDKKVTGLAKVKSNAL